MHIGKECFNHERTGKILLLWEEDDKNYYQERVKFFQHCITEDSNTV